MLFLRPTPAALAAAIFDMDGLLLDTERISLHSWRAASATIGIALPDSVFLEMIGRRHQDCIAVLRQHAGQGFDEATVSATVYADYERRLAESIPVMRGARELLKFLHAAGVPLAVATSTRRDLAEWKLRKTDLLPFFHSITSGDNVARGKPAPDIYLAAAATLGVAPPECVAFEDSSPGILSASAAGMRTVLVPDLKAPSPEAATAATVQIASLAEAPALFR